jgi:hypothetical protein
VGEQVKLVEFWDDLDDRITLLRREQYTLEAILGAIQILVRRFRPRAPRPKDSNHKLLAWGCTNAMKAGCRKRPGRPHRRLFPDSFEGVERLGAGVAGWQSRTLWICPTVGVEVDGPD